MRKLALYGAGDLGAEVAELFKRCNAAHPVFDEGFFVDDDPSARAPGSMRLLDFEGLVDEAAKHDVEAAVCVGEPSAREALARRLGDAGIALATLVHPDVELPSSVELGRGCIVYKGSFLGPNTRVGGNTLVISAFLAHNCAVGSHCVLNAHSTLACHVRVGDRAFMSIGAMAREGVSVGSDVIVGVGSAVFLDVQDGLFVAGNPAKPMRRNVDQRVFRG